MVTWWVDTAGQLYQGDMRPGDHEATQAEIDAWLASLPRLVSFSEWLALFTQAEREWAFSSNDPSVREMIVRGAAASVIDLSSPTVSEFLDLVLALGSPLTEARKTRILSGLPPV